MLGVFSQLNAMKRQLGLLAALNLELAKLEGKQKATAVGVAGEASALLFVREAYKHCKAIAAVGAGVGLLSVAGLGDNGAPQDNGGTASTLGADEAIAVGADAELPRVTARFLRAIGRHRNWDREAAATRVPA